MSSSSSSSSSILLDAHVGPVTRDTLLVQFALADADDESLLDDVDARIAMAEARAAALAAHMLRKGIEQRRVRFEFMDYDTSLRKVVLNELIMRHVAGLAPRPEDENDDSEEAAARRYDGLLSPGVRWLRRLETVASLYAHPLVYAIREKIYQRGDGYLLAEYDDLISHWHDMHCLAKQRAERACSHTIFNPFPESESALPVKLASPPGRTTRMGRVPFAGKTGDGGGGGGGGKKSKKTGDTAPRITPDDETQGWVPFFTPEGRWMSLPPDQLRFLLQPNSAARIYDRLLSNLDALQFVEEDPASQNIRDNYINAIKAQRTRSNQTLEEFVEVEGIRDWLDKRFFDKYRSVRMTLQHGMLGDDRNVGYFPFYHLRRLTVLGDKDARAEYYVRMLVLIHKIQNLSHDMRSWPDGFDSLHLPGLNRAPGIDDELHEWYHAVRHFMEPRLADAAADAADAADAPDSGRIVRTLLGGFIGALYTELAWVLAAHERAPFVIDLASADERDFLIRTNGHGLIDPVTLDKLLLDDNQALFRPSFFASTMAFIPDALRGRDPNSVWQAIQDARRAPFRSRDRAERLIAKFATPHIIRRDPTAPRDRFAIRALQFAVDLMRRDDSSAEYLVLTGVAMVAFGLEDVSLFLSALAVVPRAALWTIGMVARAANSLFSFLPGARAVRVTETLSSRDLYEKMLGEVVQTVGLSESWISEGGLSPKDLEQVNTSVTMIKMVNYVDKPFGYDIQRQLGLKVLDSLLSFVRDVPRRWLYGKYPLTEFAHRVGDRMWLRGIPEGQIDASSDIDFLFGRLTSGRAIAGSFLRSYMQAYLKKYGWPRSAIPTADDAELLERFIAQVEKNGNPREELAHLFLLTDDYFCYVWNTEANRPFTERHHLSPDGILLSDDNVIPDPAMLPLVGGEPRNMTELIERYSATNVTQAIDQSRVAWEVTRLFQRDLSLLETFRFNAERYFDVDPRSIGSGTFDVMVKKVERPSHVHDSRHTTQMKGALPPKDMRTPELAGINVNAELWRSLPMPGITVIGLIDTAEYITPFLRSVRRFWRGSSVVAYGSPRTLRSALLSELLSGLYRRRHRLASALLAGTTVARLGLYLTANAFETPEAHYYLALTYAAAGANLGYYLARRADYYARAANRRLTLEQGATREQAPRVRSAMQLLMNDRARQLPETWRSIAFRLFEFFLGMGGFFITQQGLFDVSDLITLSTAEFGKRIIFALNPALVLLSALAYFFPALLGFSLASGVLDVRFITLVAIIIMSVGMAERITGGFRAATRWFLRAVFDAATSVSVMLRAFSYYERINRLGTDQPVTPEELVWTLIGPRVVPPEWQQRELRRDPDDWRNRRAFMQSAVVPLAAIPRDVLRGDAELERRRRRRRRREYRVMARWLLSHRPMNEDERFSWMPVVLAGRPIRDKNVAASPAVWRWMLAHVPRQVRSMDSSLLF